MNSTSTCKTILSVRGLNITYKTALFHGRGLREAFIELFTSPLQFLMRRPHNLHLLNNISFDVRQGDRVGILGVNGCGKTSLCRAIAGMHGIQEAIQLHGQVRAIFDTSVVVQPELSGEENAFILANLLFSDLPKSERHQLANEALTFSELGEFRHSAFKYYSKGMKARLFLSIVSAKPCDLLILDEVFNGADAFFNEKITLRIKEMIAKSSAVLFVSHSVETVLDVCNRVIVIENQKIAFDGDVQEGVNFYLAQGEL
jgi:ABC-type polysaccharide/polyol phosphate transport system ATPase subunit